MPKIPPDIFFFPDRSLTHCPAAMLALNHTVDGRSRHVEIRRSVGDAIRKATPGTVTMSNLRKFRIRVGEYHRSFKTAP